MYAMVILLSAFAEPQPEMRAKTALMMATTEHYSSVLSPGQPVSDMRAKAALALAIAQIQSQKPEPVVEPLEGKKKLNCECGCVETGICNCKNCNNHTADRKNPGVQGRTHCSCGCEETGECGCASCDNHTGEKIAEKPDTRPYYWRMDGRFWLLYQGDKRIGGLSSSGTYHQWKDEQWQEASQSPVSLPWFNQQPQYRVFESNQRQGNCKS